MSEINLNDMQSGHHRNPFTVPEGYFDHFADDFMARLDDQPAVVHHSWWHRYRYYVDEFQNYLVKFFKSPVKIGGKSDKSVS